MISLTSILFVLLSSRLEDYKISPKRIVISSFSVENLHKVPSAYARGFVLADPRKVDWKRAVEALQAVEIHCNAIDALDAVQEVAPKMMRVSMLTRILFVSEPRFRECSSTVLL